MRCQKFQILYNCHTYNQMISSQKTLREKGECHIIFLKVWTFPKDTVKAKALVIWIPQKISFLYYGEVLKTAIIGFLIYISWPVSTSVYLCSTFTYKIFRGRIGLYLMEALLYFLYCAPFSKHAVGTWISFLPMLVMCDVYQIVIEWENSLPIMVIQIMTF